ncbi:MAG: SDR family oxidoreductase [Chloroflexi bacterium]|nr:SDR family oxidoreductase [Chloroflexota bacterium]
MHIDLSGQTALITGGAGGIGRACALTLAQAGARIAVADINLPGAQETVAASGGVALRCDLADPADAVRMARDASDALGGIDILINNAGIIAYCDGIQAVSVEAWDRLLDVNLRAPYLLSRELIQSMKARRNGRIVNFSSMAARSGAIDAGLHYACSKAGLIGLTRTLAKEGGPYGITVNALAPGIIASEPVKRQVGDREQEYAARIPLRRLGEPQDVANAVLFLVSPLASYITGVVLDINGGMYMG